MASSVVGAVGLKKSGGARKVKAGKDAIANNDITSSNEVSVSDRLDKLGNLKGLSVMKSKSNPSELKNSQLEKASKSALGNLSSQLEIRSSRESNKADRKARSSQNPNLQHVNAKKALDNTKNTLLPPKLNPSLSAKKKADDEAMKALLKSSLPKQSVKPQVLDINSPAMKRKILFEKLAAEKAADKLKSSIKSRFDHSNDKSPSLNSIQNSRPSNTKNLVKNSFALLDKPIKKEPPQKDTSDLSVKKKDGTEPSVPKGDARAPLVKNIKKEHATFLEETSVNSIDRNIPSLPTKQTSNSPPKVGLGPQQIDLLVTQFEIKDYLTRKEMRALAKQTNLTDAQVRDWFKERRIQEDTPMIIDEKNTDCASTMSLNIKQEPIFIEDNTDTAKEVSVSELGNSIVKQEPEDDEAEPNSAVLDPSTGKLLKQRKVDKKLEEILSKAPLLDSLTKKIELVNNSKVDGKNEEIGKITEIIGILDDEIEITKENIVNPGVKPLSNVLNSFLSQVEKLEKSMNVNECSKNIEIETVMKESLRKDETIRVLSTEVSENKNSVELLEKELADKNDEIESILLNSVSKETFIRTQFQSLTSEVRKLKEEKADVKVLNEKIRQLESMLRKKGHEVEDFGYKYESSQTMLKNKGQELKDLEEMSTKMVGDITKGIGEKLAVAKATENKLKAVLVKNESLESDLKELGQTFKQQNEDLIRIKTEEKKINNDLSCDNLNLNETVKEREESIKKKNDEVRMLNENLKERSEEIVKKDEDISKLKGQVNNLTQRFREKVKEIQETLSKYNDTLKSKNDEIVDKANEIVDLTRLHDTQSKLMKKMKESVGKQGQEITELKKTEQRLLKTVEVQKAELKELKCKVNYTAMVQKVSDEIEELNVDKTMDVALESRKRKSTTKDLSICKRVRMVVEPLFPLYRQQLQTSEFSVNQTLHFPIKIQVPVNTKRSFLPLQYNWPLVPYQNNNLLFNLKCLLEDSSPKLLFRTFEEPTKTNSDKEMKIHVSKRKIESDISSTSKKFRISKVNRPVTI